MKAGFLTRARVEKPTAESSRLDGLRKQLQEAQEELHRRRVARLQVEASLSPAVPPNAGGRREGEPVLAANDEAFRALTSHAAPPPTLHRLAIAAALILQAPSLVRMGELSLPDTIPWRNLQALLRKSWAAQVATGKVAAALFRHPLGGAMVSLLHARTFGCEAPLTRAEVNGVDPRCVSVFDFVEAALIPRQSQEMAHAPTPSARDAESRLEALGALDAESRAQAEACVAEQERHVAQLRKALQGATRSEAAAVAYAGLQARDGAAGGGEGALRGPAACSGSARADAETPLVEDPAAVPALAGAAPLACVAREVDPAVTDEEFWEAFARKQEDEAAPSAGSTGRSEKAAETCNAAGKSTVSCQSLQYRLNEVTVPSLQESVLLLVAQAVMEDSGGLDDRELQIIGYSEVREEDDVARQRAENVKEWLLKQGGVPPERLPSPRFVSSCSRGQRSVEVRLHGGSDAQELAAKLKASGFQVLDEDVRKHKDAMLAMAAGAFADGTAESPAASATPTANPDEALAAAIDACHVPRPAATVEEVKDERGATHTLRVVFGLAGLDPADVSVDVAPELVRFSVLSGTPPPVEMPLPYAVDALGEAAARFSRKSDSLTLKLRVVA